MAAMKTITAMLISMFIMWVLVVWNIRDIERLKHPTIVIKPAEVRRLMQSCEGVFEIKEVNDFYQVRCTK